LLEQIDSEIAKVKEEASSRKEILEKVEKWMSACEEESWLEEYNRVRHLNLNLFLCLNLFFVLFSHRWLRRMITGTTLEEELILH